MTSDRDKLLMRISEEWARVRNQRTREFIEREGDEGAVVVCAEAGIRTPFTDNLTGECACCKRQIIWRPSAPPYPKICTHCAMDMQRASQLPSH